MTKAKKDFSGVNTERVYRGIEEATAMPEETQTQEPVEEEKKKVGRPAKKLPRVNIALEQEVYDYVRTMSALKGMPMAEFINDILQRDLDANRALFDIALDFRKKL